MSFYALAFAFALHNVCVTLGCGVVVGVLVVVVAVVDVVAVMVVAVVVGW